MRLPLPTLEIFHAIVREGSFKAAAARLGVQPSTVSHQLKALETQLGTPLMIRTTRSFALTEAGRALLRGAGPAFDLLADAVESARTTGHAARGALRLAMPEFVYDLLVKPKLPSFREAFPDIDLELSVTEAFSDLLGEEMHAGFRLGDRIAQDMVAVRLTAPLQLAVLASPSYLEARGTPLTPADLLGHHCIRYRFQTSRRLDRWMFERDGGTYSVDVEGPMIVNTVSMVIELALQNQGLIYTFRDCCSAHVAEGSLVPVLERHLGTTPGIHIYFPRQYRSMVPLRLFMDHLKRQDGSVAEHSA